MARRLRCVERHCLFVTCVTASQSRAFVHAVHPSTHSVSRVSPVSLEPNANCTFSCFGLDTCGVLRRSPDGMLGSSAHFLPATRLAAHLHHTGIGVAALLVFTVKDPTRASKQNESTVPLLSDAEVWSCVHLSMLSVASFYVEKRMRKTSSQPR